MAFIVPKKRTKIEDNYKPEIGLTKKWRKGQTMSYKDKE